MSVSSRLLEAASFPESFFLRFFLTNSLSWAIKVWTLSNWVRKRDDEKDARRRYAALQLKEELFDGFVQFSLWQVPVVTVVIIQGLDHCKPPVRISSLIDG